MPAAESGEESEGCEGVDSDNLSEKQVAMVGKLGCAVVYHARDEEGDLRMERGA